MKLACVIVAAGQGIRAAGENPKQYQRLAGKPVLARTIEAMLATTSIEAVLCVIAAEHRAMYDEAVQHLRDDRLLPPAFGGATRQQSVHNGLVSLQSRAPENVLIHDAARPLVSAAVVARVVRGLERAVAVMPAIPVIDTIWHDGQHGLDAIDRNQLWRSQTPQGFRYAIILAAHRRAANDATDDIAVARQAGHAVSIVAGSEDNFKITVPEDLVRAERSIAMDVRSGTGFDVHAFCPGSFVVLCGIQIPFAYGLSGHSDADVAMHAITDAVLGALAAGDIGQWFPPSDPKWKGSASTVFLRKAVDLCRDRAMVISHLDCTIVCEAPKIAPHALEMRQSIATICDIALDRVSVKATTSEGLGFTGRREGIAALAAATLVGK